MKLNYIKNKIRTDIDIYLTGRGLELYKYSYNTASSIVTKRLVMCHQQKK